MVHFILAALVSGFAMNTAMEMHDSRIIELSHSEDGRGFILFKGYVYRSEWQPGKDAQESGWQNVRMSFTDMRFEGPVIQVDSYAADGSLSLDGADDGGFTTIPIDYTGIVALTMCLSDNFDTHVVHASSVRIRVEGEFRVEAYWDAEGNRVSASAKTG